MGFRMIDGIIMGFWDDDLLMDYHLGGSRNEDTPKRMVYSGKSPQIETRGTPLSGNARMGGFLSPGASGPMVVSIYFGHCIGHD